MLSLLASITQSWRSVCWQQSCNEVYSWSLWREINISLFSFVLFEVGNPEFQIYGVTRCRSDQSDL